MATSSSAFQGFHHHRHHHHLPCAAPPAGDKIKFTVTVQGHHWSSARHLHETLQEFAGVIERNARRLGFIGESDSIQRLQLARPDGSATEELDVDASLGDVLICMGRDKQLMAVVSTTQHNAADRPAEVSSREQQLQVCAHLSNDDSMPAATPVEDLQDYAKHQEQQQQQLFPSCECSPSVFPDDGKASSNNSVAGLGFFGLSPAATPSPAELAQFLVRGSPSKLVAGGIPRFTSTGLPVLPPNPATSFQTYVPSILGRPNPTAAAAAAAAATAACAQQGSPPNIAMLAQFLASQLRAFTPAAAASNLAQHFQTRQQQQQQQQQQLENGTEASRLPNVLSGGGTPSKQELTSNGDDNKDASSSSANMNNLRVGSCTEADGRSELVFLVNRRSKMGVGTHHLRMSDLSAYFHLSIVDAAKKLGVSQTTLKKACRKFGLKRWPGRKVRSLESTIHGLEHTIAVGQGAGMEDLTEAYMRSEVIKLQQEMDQLVHGIPAAQVHEILKRNKMNERLWT